MPENWSWKPSAPCHSQSTKTTPEEEGERKGEDGRERDNLTPRSKLLRRRARWRLRLDLELDTIKRDLSGNPRFDFVLLLTLRDPKQPILILKTGLQDLKQIQPINSDQIVQYIENGTGEQVQILPQRDQKKPSYVRLKTDRGGYVTFTTCDSPEPYKLAFDTSTLFLNRYYRVRFIRTDSITH